MADQKRFVQLFTWWFSANGQRHFCVVEKFGKMVNEKVAGGTSEGYKTTQVKLVEHLNPNPINYAIEDFWDLVDRGKLTEYIPGVTIIPDAKAVAMQPVPWMNPDNDFHV